MIYSDILQSLGNFNIVVSSNFKVLAVSSNITDSEIGEAFFQLDVVDLFSKKYFFDDEFATEVQISKSECDIAELFKSVFEGNEIHNVKKNIKLKTKMTTIYYSFFFSIALLSGPDQGEDNKAVHVSINSFTKATENEEIYKSHFDEFDEQFDLVKKVNVIGRFVIDYEVNKYKVYGNDLLPGLLGLQKSKDNFYKLNSRNADSIMENTIVKSKYFYERLDLLLKGEIDVLTDEWMVSDRWLRLEAKIFTYTDSGIPKITGGIIYDVTDFQKYKDLESVHLFYELAINSGQIGMFYYDLEKHDSSVFEANKIYADLLGIDSDKDGYYSFEDFLRVQLPIEENISEYENAAIQVNKLLRGEIYGTKDDILKIQNLKTGEIKYLLTSSKVESQFEDGKPKKFGGIVLEITDRIIRERNQTEFLYKDELTSLGNNRALAKNMVTASDGLGLFFDLDNFKRINDTYGHLMGDQMIKLFGGCLAKVADEFGNITVYRLYGDEFFVFCETRHKSFASKFERNVKEYLAKKMKTIDEDIFIEASMGYAMFKKGSNIDDFIKTADYSMYEQKISKKKREN